ncbi:MAG: transglycosylase SLT domain-containing protein [Bacteriovorax sp.]|nr:transglycosylase SLT domain-containing protein [Bacteriovorax sp.]
MKNLKIINLNRPSLLLLAALLAQSCSSVQPVVEIAPPLVLSKAIPLKGYNKFCSELTTSLPPRFENFDRKPYASEAFVIANMIAVVQPELDEETRDIIASQMSVAIKKYNIEPQVFVAIIDTESNFQSDKVSSTGDLSLAQINVEVWNKEFIRMKLSPMNKERVKMDQEYALTKMAEILNIIKQRHEKTDRRWYARYHSNTLKYKSDYLHKLEIRLKMLASSTDLTIQIAQVKNLKVLAPSISSSLNAQVIQANNLVSELLTLSPMPTPIPAPLITPQASKTSDTTQLAKLLLKDLVPASIFR